MFATAVVYAVAAITSPWAFHMGGRWTPLLYWSGRGRLVTKNGSYPLFVYFFPSSHFSRLTVDGLRPAGGLQGAGWLCTSSGMKQYLHLDGTIYGDWQSAEKNLIAFRLNERKYLDTGQQQGFFDLYGHWNGPELVMDERDHIGGKFRSGLNVENASVTLEWGSYSDFNKQCATETKFSIQR